ncbi:hypothetical protein [Ottowia thiooxydans]|uniref:Uncharacterized protein n=1 Tax=Ottowia thiooxydans TaxID=219182 RepID=A0ABV2QGX3_9BURK
MNYARADARRRGLHQEFTPLNLANDWSVPNSFKIRSTRSMVMDGARDLNLFGFEIKKAYGVIELVGSRAGKLRTVLVAVFSDDKNANQSAFKLNEEYVAGLLALPGSLFAAVQQLISVDGAFFRICKDPKFNAISTDATFGDGSSID